MNPISTLVDGALSDVRDHLVSQPPSVRTTLAPVWAIPMAGQGGALATSAPDDAADRPTARHVEAALTFGQEAGLPQLRLHRRRAEVLL